MLLLIVQVVLGVYLRLHLERGFLGRIRKWQVKGHAILGGVIPVAAWVQMLLGGIASQGFCQADHLGQCLAHFIMGSAFIAYGIVLTILLLNGQAWLARTGRSQEFWDSLIIALWGCVNTFTEHRWGNPWAHNDLQHTSMGIIWWAAGLVGMWLSRDRSGRPRRNLIPAIVILLTGWAMSAHPYTPCLATRLWRQASPGSLKFLLCFAIRSPRKIRTISTRKSTASSSCRLSCCMPVGSCLWARRRSRCSC